MFLCYRSIVDGIDIGYTGISSMDYSPVVYGQETRMIGQRLSLTELRAWQFRIGPHSAINFSILKPTHLLGTIYIGLFIFVVLSAVLVSHRFSSSLLRSPFEYHCQLKDSKQFYTRESNPFKCFGSLPK
jgi:hypothetical protein